MKPFHWNTRALELEKITFSHRKPTKDLQTLKTQIDYIKNHLKAQQETQNN